MRSPILRWGVALAVPLIASIAAPADGADPTTRSTTPATRPATSQPAPLTPGNHYRQLVVDGRNRSYLVHVPRSYDPRKPTPVVLAFHGAFMNADAMAMFCGLSRKSEEAGFVVAYPNGTGLGAMLFFNAWSAPKPGGPPDDVAFTAAVLDDLETVVHVDRRRVFATGMSNGGMMCHRLAAELSDRIAAIAPVGGTLSIADVHPKRPVPVILFHGTADTIVPFAGSDPKKDAALKFRSVADTVKTWLDVDGCKGEPKVTDYPDAAKDGTTVRRKDYGPGKDGAEVVEVDIEGGGHTWPGRQTAPHFLGKATANISANDMIWDFFQKHPMR